MPFLHGVEIQEVTTGTRPIATTRTGVIGIVGTAPNASSAIPINKPRLINSVASAAQLGLTGTLPDAVQAIFDQGASLIVVLRAEAGANEAATTANVITASDALLQAESLLGYRPRILIAPGFTHQRTTTKNAVAAKLETLATRLRGIAIVDAPNVDLTKAIEYSGDFATARTYVVDPFVLRDKEGTPTAMPSSSVFAGVLGRVDNEEGFWVSPSNKPIYNIVGLARGIDFIQGEANSQANLLNENNVATIIRHEGYRTWGTRTTSSDAKWQFLNVRRTADAINDSIQTALLWALDRGITKTLVEDVVASVNSYLKDLKAKGAIVDGAAWADPTLNSPSQISQGILTIDFDFAPTYPAERIVVRASINNNYLTEIFDQTAIA
jgi:uncharacterized protein